MNPFLNQLARRILIFDGAMGTAIHEYDLDCRNDYLDRENCSEILNQTRPEVIQSIHESFLAAGCDAVETNSFGANKLVFAEFDLVDRTYKLNRMAAEIARAACDRFHSKDKPRFVVGSMGPGTKLITLGQTDWNEMFDSYREQARGLIDGGADALLIETAQDPLQVKCVINAALAAIEDCHRKKQDLPIMAQVTIETTGTMLVGTEISAVATALKPFSLASLGLNCATGPNEMIEHLRWLGRHWDRPISVQPNAGLPALIDGRTEYPLQPDPFAEAMLHFVEHDGVAIVGGCCGTTPKHIFRLVQAIDNRAPARLKKSETAAACTSLYGVTDFRQDASILNIGERTNASGSRAFKRLLEAEDWDGCVSIARQQLRDGSHVIDLNVDYAGRNNAADMGELASRFARQVNVPVMLDSTQPETIEAGLRRHGGKCIINSANLENGEQRFKELCALAHRYGAAIVLGAIDEDQEEAMARTADRKIAITRRMHDLAVHGEGLNESDLFFDPLVLPITTGMDKDRRSALETIEGVRRIASEFPHCQVAVGLSNVSFGLKPAARVVLNSVFLNELVKAGLTGAILHASKILPRNRIDDEKWEAALKLIYDRRDPADGDPLQRYIDLFVGDEEIGAVKQDLSTLSLEQRLQQHIIDGEKEKLIETLEAARRIYAPLDIINDHLLTGMKVVGDLFGSGQMQLPFVLQSAEVMKMAVSHLEPFMEKVEGRFKGSIVLATVKGDVHDIGKNLVDIILTNNGYTVQNLGIRKPIGDIIEKWRESQANAIGLSGLLVKSVAVMKENLEELNERKLAPPILLGGAALSRHYCETELRNTYRGSVYYGKDAFEALHIMNLLSTDGTAQLDENIEKRLKKRTDVEKRLATSTPQSPPDSRGAAVQVMGRGTVTVDVEVPTAPFTGSRIVADIDPDQIYPFLNLTALYRGQWQFRKGRLSERQYKAQIEEEVNPILERLKTEYGDRGILAPKVAYGYFSCCSEGDDLVLYDAQDRQRILERFTFPRQISRRHLCISDFFHNTDSNVTDVVGLMCVTMGSEVSQHARALFEADRYKDYLYLHGFGVECAEALAEMWHKRMRQELGISGDDKPTPRELFAQGYRGSRYSFGYPACPDMSDQQKLFRLLQPDRIGCFLTENWQIDPEQSTSAIIVHHAEAKYFNV